ncbi:MAG: PEGA domain-containing protein, partial [Myxococcales bacterium]|nr:PEGA domain-containing protein [Myxococcales bacterium]
TLAQMNVPDSGNPVGPLSGDARPLAQTDATVNAPDMGLATAPDIAIADAATPGDDTSLLAVTNDVSTNGDAAAVSSDASALVNVVSDAAIPDSGGPLATADVTSAPEVQSAAPDTVETLDTVTLGSAEDTDDKGDEPDVQTPPTSADAAMQEDVSEPPTPDVNELEVAVVEDTSGSVEQEEPENTHHNDHHEEEEEESGTGTIAVFATVRGRFDVYVDGEHIGRTPVRGYELPVGRYRVELREVSGNREGHRTARVRRGEQTSVRVDVE